MKYQSMYSDGLVSAAEFATEILCKRRADKQGIVLCSNFWKKENRKKFFAWSKIYTSEIIYIRNIIREHNYSGEAIVRALLRKECSWILSSRNKKLEEFIIEEQRKLDVEDATKEETKLNVANPNEKPKKRNVGRKSKLNKLR
jgi:hypothetical protein